MDNSRKSRSLRSRLESFCNQHHVGILYVFGSRGAEIRKMLDEDAGVEPAKSSDVDIAVKLSGDRTLSVREKTELSVTMENLLGVDRADVILLSEADPFLAVNIIRGERLFCADQCEADEYELYVLRRAGDLAPFERMRIERIMDSSARGSTE
jgi:predicted nucleotidyltransferase